MEFLLVISFLFKCLCWCLGRIWGYFWNIWGYLQAAFAAAAAKPQHISLNEWISQAAAQAA